MRKTILVLAIIFSLYSVVQASYQQNPAEVSSISSVGNFFTEVSGDALTVDIRDASLEEVLQRISSLCGIRIFLPPSLKAEKVMVRFSKLKLDEGLSKILAPYNRIFIYKETKSGGQDAPTKLAEVRIYTPQKENKEGIKEAASLIEPQSSPSSSVNRNEGVRSSGHETAEVKRETLGDTAPGDSRVKGSTMTVDKVKSLAASGSSAGAIGSLASALRDKDPAVKQEAERALKNIGEKLKEERVESGEEDDKTPSPDAKEDASLTLSGGTESSVSLELNNDVPVRGIQFTLEGAKPSDIRTTSRAEGFVAQFNEKNGKVVLVSISGGKISPGSGPICEVGCDSPGAAKLSKIRISK